MPNQDTPSAAVDASPPVLGHVARALRQQAHMTLRKLAAMTGIRHVDIGMLERGLWAPSAFDLGRIFTAIYDAQRQLDERATDGLDERINSRGYAPEGTGFIRCIRLMPRHLRGSLGASMRDLRRERDAERAEDDCASDACAFDECVAVRRGAADS